MATNMTHIQWKERALLAWAERNRQLIAQHVYAEEQERAHTAKAFKEFLAGLGIEADPQGREATVDDVTFRYYGYKPWTDYSWGWEKHVVIVGECADCGGSMGESSEITDQASLGNALSQNGIFPHRKDSKCSYTGQIARDYEPSAAERLVALIQEIAREVEA